MSVNMYFININMAPPSDASCDMGVSLLGAAWTLSRSHQRNKFVPVEEVIHNNHPMLLKSHSHFNLILPCTSPFPLFCLCVWHSEQHSIHSNLELKSVDKMNLAQRLSHFSISVIKIQWPRLLTKKGNYFRSHSFREWVHDYHDGGHGHRQAWCWSSS